MANWADQIKLINSTSRKFFDNMRELRNSTYDLQNTDTNPKLSPGMGDPQMAQYQPAIIEATKKWIAADKDRSDLHKANARHAAENNYEAFKKNYADSLERGFKDLLRSAKETAMHSPDHAPSQLISDLVYADDGYQNEWDNENMQEYFTRYVPFAWSSYDGNDSKLGFLKVGTYRNGQKIVDLDFGEAKAGSGKRAKEIMDKLNNTGVFTFSGQDKDLMQDAYDRENSWLGNKNAFEWGNKTAKFDETGKGGPGSFEYYNNGDKDLHDARKEVLNNFLWNWRMNNYKENQ